MSTKGSDARLFWVGDMRGAPRKMSESWVGDSSGATSISKVLTQPHAPWTPYVVSIENRAASQP